MGEWNGLSRYYNNTVIGSIFNISIDELFDFDKTKIESEIIAVVDEAYKYRHDYPNKSAAILKAGLEKYPNNEVLLNNLMMKSNMMFCVF